MKFVCLRYPKLEMTYKPEIKREVNGVILKEATQKIKFENSYYETDDKDKIAFIKKHRMFNLVIFVDESEVIQKPKVVEKPENPYEDIQEQPIVNEHAPAVPKKRGRKPKAI